jgi:hypothetical protein
MEGLCSFGHAVAATILIGVCLLPHCTSVFCFGCGWQHVPQHATQPSVVIFREVELIKTKQHLVRSHYLLQKKQDRPRDRDWLVRINQELKESKLATLNPSSIREVMNAWAKTSSTEGAEMIDTTQVTPICSLISAPTAQS